MKYYHGSITSFFEGDILLPGIQFNKEYGCCEVYLTTDIKLAMQYATYDGWVYLCEPIGEVEGDFCDEQGNPFTFFCNSAKIIACIW